MKNFSSSIFLGIVLMIVLSNRGYSLQPSFPDQSAVEPAWRMVLSMGGTGGPICRDMVNDLYNNSYAIGHFNGKINLLTDSLTSTGVSDLFLIKFNPAGTPLWWKKIAGGTGDTLIGAAIRLYNNSDIYITGSFTGIASFPASQLTSAGGKDVFIAKFDNSGTNIWAQRYGNGGVQMAGGLALDASGNAYLPVNNLSSSSTDLAFFNANGQLLSVKSFASTVFRDIAFNNSKLYVTGYLTGQSYFGAILLTSGNYPSSFLGKLDLSSNTLWVNNCKSYDTGASTASSIAFDDAGNVYNAGCYCDSIVFPTPGIFLSYANGSLIFSYYIAKYSDLSGNCLWASQVNRDLSYEHNCQVVIDNSDVPYLFTRSDNETDFGFVQGYSEVIPFISKFDAFGVLQWTKDAANIPATTLSLSYGGFIQYATVNDEINLNKINANGVTQWTWESSSDGGEADIWYQMAVDQDGFIYAHGNIYNSGYFFGTRLQGNGTYLARIRGDGSLKWLKMFSTPSQKWAVGSGVTADKSDNSYAWGSFADSLYVDNQWRVMPGSPGDRGYFVKYDKFGAFQWIQLFYSTGILTGVGGITTDNAGNVLIIGNYFDSLRIGNYRFHSSGSQDFFVAKFSSSGTLLNAASFGGTGYEWGRGIACDGSNNIYITGGFHSTVNFGVHSLTSFGGYDAFIAKYDPSFNETWARQAGSTNYERAFNIATDFSGSSYISGQFYGYEMSFGSIVINSPDYNNLFVAKYSSDGTPQWAHQIESPYYSWPAYQIGLDEEGSCYVGGQYQSTLTFHEGTALSGRNSNSFLAKYASSGTYQWNKNIVANNSYTIFDGLAVYNKNSILVGGRVVNEQLDFGAIPVSPIGCNAVIALLGDPLPNGIEVNATADRFVDVFPNPASDQVFLKFSEPPLTRVTWRMTDGSGKAVLAGQSESRQIVEIQLPALASGTYILSVFANGKIATEKMVIL
ncbi:MAG: T9SS type A sorting domain-containing protein [Bacteroidetes bacterium]|nr:T9SS type A sorting domain-containing protein [Bacteroidota bacterium]